MRRIVRSAPIGFFCTAFAITLSAGVASEGCGSDWTVRGFDAGPDDAAPIGEGGALVDSGGSVGDGGPCDAILSDLAVKRAKAITCTLGEVSDCSSSLADECGCSVFVGVESSITANDYASAIEQAKSAGCAGACNDCASVPVRGSCIETGSSFTCSPP